MTVHVNGKVHNVAPGTTVLQLLEQLDIDPRNIALARNDEIVHRRTLGDVVLEDGDAIEIISVLAGG